MTATGKELTRKQKLLLNSGTGLLKQAVALVCGFILPRFFLLYYGNEINGLISSITRFLSFISFLEMGIGPVIQANLYQPLAEDNRDRISVILLSSERFFRRIAFLFIGYIAILAVAFPTLINTEFDWLFTASLIVIIALSSFAEYFFGISYQLLLNADQRSYVPLSLQAGFTILNAILCILLITLGAPIHLVKLVSSLIFVVKPLLLLLYVKKHYAIDRTLKLEGEPIEQKWNGFAQHFSAVVTENIDVVILTFISLTLVSVYSVYFAVVSGIATVILTAVTGLEAYFGNMLAKGENEALCKAFTRIEFLVHNAVTFVFTVTAVTIVPFVTVYTRGVENAEVYRQPAFAVLLTAAYAAQCLRIPYFRLIKAAKHFKETQNGAFIATGINLVLSVALVVPLGMTGIAVGTLAAMLFHTLYFVFYLRSHLLCRSPWHFGMRLLVDLVCALGSAYLSHWFSLGEVSYLSWILLAMKVCAVTFGVMAIVNLPFYAKKVLIMIKNANKN